MARFRVVAAGDTAPWFRQATSSNPTFNFDTVGGRYIVLCFFGTAGDATGRAMLSLLDEERDLFDDRKFSFFGVSFDPADRSSGRVTDIVPGIRHFWDFDRSVGQLYGAADIEGSPQARRIWVILDPTMRVASVIPAGRDGEERRQVAALLKSLPPIGQVGGLSIQAPILVLPNVFEADLCASLIALYEQHGGTESGFMREVDGKTVVMADHRHKRRSDFVIEDETLSATLRGLIVRRIVPQVKKAHQFEATRMERYIVSCYDSRDGGHFGAHRDNTTKGTAHRRFAVSVNLNDDFEGGEVYFPEYGPTSYKAPAGGAVVFSCSLLHAVTPVTAGRRFAFLPFLYDDAAAAVRAENNKFLGDNVGQYQAS